MKIRVRFYAPFLRFFAPEVVQTSEMDCGPACLKSVLAGFRISAGYDRLRDLCQTDLDGTSIDTVEEVGKQLGLNAEQLMVPADYLLLRHSRVFPAVVVVKLPNGFTHFIVVWRRFGRYLQVMDPATGRHWVTQENFLSRVYVHPHHVSAADWREYAGSGDFLSALRRRARALRIPRPVISQTIAAALEDPGWRSIAAVDAALRMIHPIANGARLGGSACGRLLEQLLEKTRQGGANLYAAIPTAYWSVLTEGSESGEEEQVVFRGAVLVRVRSRRLDEPQTSEESEAGSAPPLADQLRAPAASPFRQLLRFLRVDGLLTPVALGAALVLSAAGVVVEALLYRTFLDITGVLGLSQQRLTAIGMLLAFLGVLLVLDLLVAGGLLGIGRRLEARFRIHLLEKIPFLPDRYFSSRLVSDMAERGHTIHQIRMLPALGGQLVHFTFQLLVTTAGIIWLDPNIAPIVISSALLAIAMPILGKPIIAERDLRYRTHSGGLAGFYFDALRGLLPVRAHVAEKALQSEHESRLVSWIHAALSFQRAAVSMEGIGLVSGWALTAWLLLGHIQRNSESTVGLLIVYWALNIPAIGKQLAEAALIYPRLRNLAARLTEPLDAPIGEPALAVSEATPAVVERQPCVSIQFENVTVKALGQTILEPFSLAIEPRTHVCIVGPSGAGKSSLVGLLLGWHSPATGQVKIDGEPLRAEKLKVLRSETAWVDPNIQLWNRSLVENLRYGVPAEHGMLVGQAVAEADLFSLVERLPDGLQSTLGEGGALVSGGEGQRVRLGRATLRRQPRLVILDEPFSALDREKRQKFLRSVRKRWSAATLLCITHDIRECLGFERVMVMDHGRIVEYGAPSELAQSASSIFSQLLAAEQAVQQLWQAPLWRKVRVDHGQIIETGEQATQEHDGRHLLARRPPGRSARSTRAGVGSAQAESEDSISSVLS